VTEVPAATPGPATPAGGAAALVRLPTTDLKGRRQVLLDDRATTGQEWCNRYAGVVDEWLRAGFARACDGDDAGVALLAVGGYGLAELAPRSDLDLLLVVDRPGPVGPLAEAMWYPIWDAGMDLDHSVRTPKEVRQAVDADLKVALGLLTARVVAGDLTLGTGVIQGVLEQWRSRASSWLPRVDAAIRARHAEFGDLAFLLEPDLKEARGGLRDLRVLQAVARVSPVLAEVVATPGLERASGTLADARVELQRATGKPSNRLLLQDQDVVAAALGRSDADELMAEIATAARTLAWASDDGWRRVTGWLAGPKRRKGLRTGTRKRRGNEVRPLEPGLVLRDDEVALAEGADPATDPSLALRAAAVSAGADVPIARECLDRLAAEIPEVPGTWPPELLQALLRLLGTGRPAIAAIEALDSCGIWIRLLPEWAPVRHRPQRNAYHRFTVDRHLLETVAHATELVRDVERPDLLLAGALLHDIGKGRGGDHTAIGIGVVEAMAPRLGFGPADTAVLVSLVRLHLLLPEVATRRDLDDPATIDAVAAEVGDRGTLELLAALTEADSQATGPSMWSPWKAGLLTQLVERTGHRLAGRPVPAEHPSLTEDERRLLGTGRPELAADGHRVSVAAPDRRALLATVAGVLTLSGATVRSASTNAESGNQAFLRFEVAPAFDVLPGWRQVGHDLTAALDGDLPLAGRLAERERGYVRRRALAPHPVRIRVIIDNDAATSSTVVEVRAPDRGPLLYHLALAISEAGFDIVSAMVSTLGAEAIDVFYVQAGRDPVTGTGGRKLAGEEQPGLAAALTAAVEALA
jgi:[protein-PII] uridylyltransferase